MRKVLVIGGSRGIGAACVRRFRQAGDQVAFTWLKAGEAAKDLAVQTGASGFQCDAASEEAMLALPARLPFQPQVLVCCAGSACTALIQDMTKKEWDHLFDQDVGSMFLAVKAFMPGMIRRGKGCIVTIASMWGETGASCEAAYSAAKGAVIAFTKALAKEAGPSGIRVNCVSPGVIDTDMMAGYTMQDKQALSDETPLGRLGRPEEVADTVFYLSGEGSSFVSGAVVRVNGGFLI